MNWAIVTAKVDPKVKKAAQKAAKEAGVPLSSVIKASLKDFARTKTVTFSSDREEIPNAHFKRVIAKARKNRKEGKHSPVFDTAEESIAWLKKQGIL